ncbi:hypothetical protein [Cohnella hashimotonis]|uniref:Tail fiber protein n=1 Tax=Cohnella hashimotonis TaxID=2826895 RepID=A0ABT6TNS8_9BACL|nr:hypothetical protein [Cohnella hashimotonis]MDI4648513.1 hypothetical protein [Cohnella hashimotonis]
MAIFTSILNLLKKNPATDGADTFNIQTMLNDNWDKIDAAMALKGAIGSVRAATASNTTLSGLQTVDGVSLAAGDRVLVKNQTTGSQNGIYVAASGAWARAADADSSAKLAAGLWGYVREGTVNGGKSFVLSNAGAVTLGTTALTFAQMSGAGAADDTVIGSRTATDSVTPAMSGTLTGVLSSLFTLVKGITGKSSALTGPAITLEATKSHVDAGLAHGAVSAPTASTMMARDSAGRAQVAAPSAAADIARKDTVDAAIATAASDATTKANSAQAAAIAAAATDATTKANSAQSAAISAAATDATTKANAVQSNLTAHIGTGGAAHAAATSSVAGFMTAADKTKLDGMASGAGGAGTATDAVIGNRTISDATAPTGDTGSLTTLLGWLANMITAITGGANWRTAPVKSLAALNTEKASLASPTFTGTPAAPTATAGTNTTQIATTAFATAANNAHAANNSHIPFAVATGSANVYAVTISPAPAALTAGLALAVQMNVANTGATTINVNGLGAKDVLSSKGLALTSGKLVLNGVYTLRYNGTAFILQGEGGEYGTAAAAQVLLGYSVGTESGIVSGTMPNNGALSFTPSASSQTVPAGYTSGGSVAAVSVDASKVLAGTTIAGTTGTMPNRSGDTPMLSYSVSGQTLRLLPSLGYRNGTSDYVTITDSNFQAANIRKNVSIMGVAGTYVPTTANLGFDTPLWRVKRIEFGAEPSSIAIDNNGNTYMSKSGYTDFYKYDKTGNFVQTVSLSGGVSNLITYSNYLFLLSGSTIFRYDVNNIGGAPTSYNLGMSGKLIIRGGSIYVWQGYPLTVIRLNTNLQLLGTWTPLNGANVYTVLFDDNNIAYIGVNTGTYTNMWYKGSFGGAVSAIGSTEGSLSSPTIADINSDGTRLLYGRMCYNASGASLISVWNMAYNNSMLPDTSGIGLIKYVGNNVFVVNAQDGTGTMPPYPFQAPYGFAKFSASGSLPVYEYKAFPAATISKSIADYNPVIGMWAYTANEYALALGYEKF